MSNSIKDSAQAFAVNQVLKYVDSNPQEAFPKLLDWADKFDNGCSSEIKKSKQFNNDFHTKNARTHAYVIPRFF